MVLVYGYGLDAIWIGDMDRLGIWIGWVYEKVGDMDMWGYG